MAAAAEAERKRLERSDGDQSPMPETTYDRWRGELSLVNPRTGPLDAEIAAACRAFERTDNSDRAAARRSVSMDEFYTLLAFSRRAAVVAMRDRTIEHLRDGLTAITMIEADRVDFRDILVALSLIHHAAIRIGADSSLLFHDAAMRSEPAVARLINEFVTRPPEHQGLRDAWGHVEIETADGVGFVRWGFKPPSWDACDDPTRTTDSCSAPAK